MKCPHCIVSFHDDWSTIWRRSDVDGDWMVQFTDCPSCKRLILRLLCYEDHVMGFVEPALLESHLVRPFASSRPPCPHEVPKDIAEDYNEACLVVGLSPKASAALSRRALQAIFHDKGIKKKNLSQEIDAFIADPASPSHLTRSVDLIRNIGNFSAHPIKGTQSGEILPVEPEEAEWSLEVLESLFDYYYVQPEALEKKRLAMNAKLGSAGKPDVK